MSRTPALMLALATLTLAACTSQAPDPSASTTSPGTTRANESAPPASRTPTPPAPSPTATAGVQDVTAAPERPAALDGPATEENAKEVGRYFMSLFPYSVATGDLDSWNSLSGPSCRYCESLRDVVAEIHDAGNHGTGGALELGFTSGIALAEGEFVVGLEYRETPSQTVAPDGTVVADFPDRNSMKANISLTRTGSSWVVNGVDVRSGAVPREARTLSPR